VRARAAANGLARLRALSALATWRSSARAMGAAAEATQWRARERRRVTAALAAAAAARAQAEDRQRALEEALADAQTVATRAAALARRADERARKAEQQLHEARQLATDAQSRLSDEASAARAEAADARARAGALEAEAAALAANRKHLCAADTDGARPASDAPAVSRRAGVRRAALMSLDERAVNAAAAEAPAAGARSLIKQLVSSARSGNAAGSEVGAGALSSTAPMIVLQMQMRLRGAALVVVNAMRARVEEKGRAMRAWSRAALS
jgi:chromosome segregation ATPase